jgi:DNA-binding FadR family transcriptional regulator
MISATSVRIGENQAMASHRSRRNAEPAAGNTLTLVGAPDDAPTGPAPKLAEQLAAMIQVRIADSDWPVGSVLGSETDLLAEYGVSRAVFREAVRILENLHVARMRRGPGGGLVVLEPDSRSITRAAALYLDYSRVTAQNLYEARLGIESLTVERATQRINEAGIARLRTELDAEGNASGQGVFGHSHELHQTIAELSGNPALQLFTQVLVSLTSTHGREAYVSLNSTKDRRAMEGAVHQAHRRIVEAMIAGDEGLARHRMRRHLEAMSPHLA